MGEEKKLYNKGDMVPENGIYICVPCGFRQNLKNGDTFGECTSCLAGTEDGQEEYTEGTGLWEKLNNNNNEA